MLFGDGILDRTLFVATRGAVSFKNITLDEYLTQRSDEQSSLGEFVLQELQGRAVVVENDTDLISERKLADQREIFFRHLAGIVLNTTPYTNELFEEAEQRRKEYQKDFLGDKLALPGTFEKTEAYTKFVVKLRLIVDRWIANGEIDISAVLTSIQENFKKEPNLLDANDLQLFESFARHIEPDIEEYVQKNHKLIKELGEKATQKQECFPVFCKAYVKGRGVVTMDCLQVGDRVLTSEKGVFSFENIFCFSHAELQAVTPFVQITTSLGKTVTLSPNHLLPVNNTDALRAANDVRIADHVFVRREVEESLVRDKVVSVGVVVAEGLYCPHTSSGSLIVDDVLVSCYTTVLPPLAQQVLLTPLAWLYRWLPSAVYDRVVPYHKETGMPYIVKLLRSLV